MRNFILFGIFTLVLFSSQIKGQDLWQFFDNTNFEKYNSENEELRTSNTEKDRVVFMGNSITEAWPIMRPQFFENANYIGRGISGQTTPQMLLRFRRDVIDLGPKVVVILAGINDIAQNTGFTPNELIAENIMTMCDIARQHHIKVILCSVTPAIDFPWNPAIKPVNKIIELNILLENYAKNNDIPYIDYHTALKDNDNGLRVPEFTTADDLVHPNAAGYIVMENLLQPVIDKALAVSALSVNAFFADHMILQQQENVPVWGRTLAGHEVKVVGSWGEESTALADENGAWNLELKTPKAGGPYTIRISSTHSTIVIVDVLIGEVWLASGQSNMAMPLKGWPPRDPISHSFEEIAQANYSEIRMFKVANKFSMKEENTFDGEWDVCTPEHAADFSATAYFFARRLHQKLNIPIGIIHASWGGTPAESWISKQQIKELGDFEELIKALENPETERLTREWYDRWEKTLIPTEVSEWNHIDLNDEFIAQPDYQIKDWWTVRLPGRLDLVDGKGMDGAFWLRKTVELNDITSNYTFVMGFADDTDVVYFNGEKIGSTSYDFINSRAYSIPKNLLRKGKNTIAIRIIDTGGPGSINNEIRLRNDNNFDFSLKGNWDCAMTAEINNEFIYSYDMEKLDFTERPSIVYLSPYSTPSSLYNAMINPLIPYTFKGAIWYQGESNVGRAEQYKRVFPALIKDWRAQWNRTFPFYFVQIAPYEYNVSGDAYLDESQYLRDAQRQTLSLEKTGMVVTLDIGNNENIHPANKQDVGGRLAGLALANEYGKSIIASGPLYRSAEIKRKKILVEFDFIGSGLVLKDTGPTEFEIAGADKKFVPAEVRINKSKIEVSASSISAPKFVRYAWRDTSVGSLFNEEGLPASSFTTE